MKTNSITFWRRLLYGATLVGVSGLNLFTATQAQTPECTPDIVVYEDATILSCSGADVSYKLSNPLLYDIKGTGWGLSSVYDNNGSSIPVLNSSGSDFNSITVAPGQFKTFKFIFVHSDGRTCYIQRDIEVISPPTLTLSDKNLEGCVGVLTKVNPTAEGDYDGGVTWTKPATISETKPPFTLPGAGSYTIKGTVSKNGCPGQKEAEITYTVNGKPSFDIAQNGTTYNFPKNTACKSCLVSLSNDETAITNSLSATNATAMSGPLEISGAKIVWGNNPNPAAKLNANTTFKGTYTATVQSTNNCGTSDPKNVSITVTQLFTVEDCAPTILPSSPPCLGDNYTIWVRMPKGVLDNNFANYNFQSNPTVAVEPTFKNGNKELSITIKAIQNNIANYTFSVPYQIACPHTSQPIQNATAPNPVSPKAYGPSSITLKSGAGCGFTSTYEYCTESHAVYTIRTSSDGIAITGVDLGSKANLFNTPVISADKKTCQVTSKAVITDANKAQHEPITATISYTSGGKAATPFSENKTLDARTDCGASLSVSYRWRVEGEDIVRNENACAGDTILLTLFKNASSYELVGLDIPFGAHTSGDVTPFKRETEGDYTAFTYRFISYHCYVKGGEDVADSVMPFTVRYKFNGVEESKTIYEHIKVKTCPPKSTYIGIPRSPKNFGDPMGVPVKATNRTTDTEHWRIVWNLKHNSLVVFNKWEFLTGNPAENIDSSMWQANYKVFAFRNDTSNNVEIYFNEGDSLRSAILKNLNGTDDFIFTVKELANIRPSKPQACAGDKVDFVANLSAISPKYCTELKLTWNTPAVITHTNTISYNFKDGKNLIPTDSAFFYHTEDARPGTYKDYQWTLSFKILTLDTVVTFQLYPPPTFFVRGSTDVFRSDILHICQGQKFEFDSLVKDPDIVAYYTLNRDPTYWYLNGDFKRAEPADAGPVKAYLSGLDCDIDPLELSATLVLDEPISTGTKPTWDGPLCLGNTVNLTLNSNGLITWIRQESGKPDDTLCHNCLTNQKIPVLLDKPQVKVVAKQVNSCQKDPVEVSFNEAINAYPDITMTADTGACPYTTIDFKAKINGNETNTTGSYTFFNLRNGQPISTAALTADGLKSYLFGAQDSLLLCYNSISHGECKRFDTARLVAYPSPVLQVTANGDNQTNQGVYCLPNGTKKLTLRASGANEYTWLVNNPHPTGKSLVLEGLKQDSLVRVLGVENQHNCTDTFALTCVIAVGQKAPSAAICPGDAVGACFEADSLPGTTYTWSGPNGYSQASNDLAKGFKVCGITQAGTYTLNASRNGCSSPYNYTLAYHPTPELTPFCNSPLCQGSMLAINFKSNLPVSNLAQKILTHNGVTVGADQYREGSDRIIYEKNNVQLSDTGTYRFHVTTTQSCSTESEIRVEVDTAIPVRIRFASAKTDSFCEGELSLLKAEIETTNDSYRYEWYVKVAPSGEQTLGNESVQPLRWERFMHNNYIYVKVNQRSCSSKDSVKASVLALPVLSNMPGDTGICFDKPFYLDPTADVVPQMVVWYYMDDNDVTEIRQRGAALPYHIEKVDMVHAGRYFFAAENAKCTAYSDTVRLSVYPLPQVKIEGPSFICSGSTVTLTAIPDMDGTCLWPHSAETSNQVVIDKAGTYWVVYTSVKGCENQDSTTLEGRETPYFQLPGDTSICRGTSFVIVGPEGLDAYQWQDGSTDKDRTIEKDGLYFLTGYKNECPFTDSIFVKMTFCGQFHIPTAFTPNGNGINDLWGAISSAKDEDMAEFDLMVFDRDGRVVFHGKKISDRWDGRYKGQLCPPAVYPFTFRALEKFEGIRYQASGTVTIVQ